MKIKCAILFIFCSAFNNYAYFKCPSLSVLAKTHFEKPQQIRSSFIFHGKVTGHPSMTELVIIPNESKLKNAVSKFNNIIKKRKLHNPKIIKDADSNQTCLYYGNINSTKLPYAFVINGQY